MKRRTMLLLLIGALAAVSGYASPTGEKFPVDPRQISALLSAVGVRTSPEQVHLLSAVHANRDNAALEIVSAEPWQRAGAQVLLRCQKRQECLPFYVLVSWPTPRAAETLLRQFTDAHTRAVAPVSPQRGPLLVHRGERATLVIRSEHMLVKLSVICLASGDAGKHVRVSSTDRKRTFEAEVVGRGLLKGAL